jgi:hypothetical protein
MIPERRLNRQESHTAMTWQALNDNRGQVRKTVNIELFCRRKVPK